MDTKSVVEKYFESINNQDWNTWLTLFTDDVTVEDSISGKRKGLDSLRDTGQNTIAIFKKFENHIIHLVVNGDLAMVVCHISAITKNDVKIESTGANFYHVKNGKIRYMQSLHDTVPFFKAFGIEK